MLTRDRTTISGGKGAGQKSVPGTKVCVREGIDKRGAGAWGNVSRKGRTTPLSSHPKGVRRAQHGVAGHMSRDLTRLSHPVYLLHFAATSSCGRI